MEMGTSYASSNAIKAVESVYGQQERLIERISDPQDSGWMLEGRKVRGRWHRSSRREALWKGQASPPRTLEDAWLREAREEKW